MASFTLAATSADDVGGIICSFDSRWQNAIHDGRIKAIFRKKRLAKTPPQWLYVYVGSPVSSITARVPIESVEVMALQDALEIAEEGDISPEELSKYAGAATELFVFKVGAVQVAKVPLGSDKLRADYRFFPSPNFIRLSESGAKTIDRLAKFKKKE
ncbi:MAG TPA: hypothetical protein DIT97_10555 [Gimesia maris]|uniref:ASCH domain-containing protein n=1 Tax=Gimesia maris TaxID=122 RepID=A0A3D3R4E6_9PLAN|nr:hypothetical protein [Gimesia maris]|tara:strand:+ start:3135 stop:3605 length:471 start_codon:yes stop_codon:yes gene_type:complete